MPRLFIKMPDIRRVLLTINKSDNLRILMEANDIVSMEAGMELTRVEEILGGKKVLHKKIQDQMDMVELIEQGLTKEAAMHLAKALGITNKRLAELLPVSKRTFL